MHGMTLFVAHSPSSKTPGIIQVGAEVRCQGKGTLSGSLEVSNADLIKRDTWALLLYHISNHPCQPLRLFLLVEYRLALIHRHFHQI
jgi:hypothetical protein